jgi:hypothetical protein
LSCSNVGSKLNACEGTAAGDSWVFYPDNEHELKKKKEKKNERDERSVKQESNEFF